MCTLWLVCFFHSTYQLWYNFIRWEMLFMLQARLYGIDYRYLAIALSNSSTLAHNTLNPSSFFKHSSSLLPHNKYSYRCPTLSINCSTSVSWCVTGDSSQHNRMPSPNGFFGRGTELAPWIELKRRIVHHQTRTSFSPRQSSRGPDQLFISFIYTLSLEIERNWHPASSYIMESWESWLFILRIPLLQDLQTLRQDCVSYDDNP